MSRRDVHFEVRRDYDTAAHELWKAIDRYMMSDLKIGDAERARLADFCAQKVQIMVACAATLKEKA